MASSTSLVPELTKAAEAYKDSLERYHAVTSELTAAKRELENTRNALVCKGVEGKNKAERDAKLESLLIDTQVDVFELEDKQSRAKLTVEKAKLDWDLARYKVRACEAVGGRA